LSGLWMRKTSGGTSRPLIPREVKALQRSIVGLLGRLCRQLPSLHRASRLHLHRNGRILSASLTRARRVLRKLHVFCRDRLKGDERRFVKTYGHVDILPPDQYRALLVRVTEGCAWNRCAFCRFYKDRAFRVRPMADIVRHVKELKRFFGQATRSRVSIFLGDADIFGASPALLRRVLPFLAGEFPFLASPQADGMGGFHAFGEVTGALRWAPEDLRALAALGLRRVTLGLETGSDEVRRTLHKPGTANMALQAVRRLKAAGIHVSPVILLGAGGQRLRAAHREGTTALLNALPLDKNDIVYFSPIREGRAAGTLTEAQMAAQKTVFSAVLARRPPSVRPRAASYDIRAFRY
jgi:hypothetical protein